MSRPTASVEQALVQLAAAPHRVALAGPYATTEAFLARVGGWRAAVDRAGARTVAVFHEDRVDFTAALCGALLAGAEVVLPGDALPTTLAALRPRCDGWLGQLPGALAAVEGAQPASGPLDPEARLTIFTSGSTGEPAAIGKALRQLSCEVLALEATFGAALDDATVQTTVSHQHIYGLLFTVLWPLAAGRPLAALRLEYPEQLEAALGERPSVLVSSPAHLKRLPEGRAWALPGLRAVFSSGGPLSEEGARRAREVLGQPAVEVYGSSETGGIAWRRRADAANLAWTALPGVRWTVADGGALEVRSPHLPDDQPFLTADLVTPNASGTFTLTGRADRLAKVEEKRVSLSALEARLRQGGLVGEVRAAVVGAPRAVVGVVAVPTDAGRALLERGRRALGDALRAQLQDTIERVALPRRFRFVDALPVDARGKTTEAAVRELLAPSQPTVTWLERSATRAVGEFEVDPTLRFFDGHFPDTPIVPGVAQLHWAVGWAHEAFGSPLFARRLDALKFSAPVLPGERLRVQLEWSPERSVLTFTYVRGATHCSSGRLTLGNTP